MGARIRETRGVSWRDPRQPGVRRWRSQSISVGAGWYFIGWLILYGVLWPFVLGPLWLVIESLMLFASALIVATGVLSGHGYWDGIVFQRAGPFVIFDLIMKP